MQFIAPWYSVPSQYTFSHQLMFAFVYMLKERILDLIESDGLMCHFTSDIWLALNIAQCILFISFIFYLIIFYPLDMSLTIQFLTQDFILVRFLENVACLEHGKHSAEYQKPEYNCMLMELNITNTNKSGM